MLSTVSPLANGGSEVLVNAEIDLVGKIVQFGRGMIEEVSRQMFRQFSTCMTQQLQVTNASGQSSASVAGDHTPEVKAVSATKVGSRALWAIVVRFFRRLFGKKEQVKS
jgi:hypothetical protein